MYRRSRRLLTAALALFLAGAWGAEAQQVPPLPADPSAATPGVVVETLQVRGNARIEASTIQVVSALEEGRRATSMDVQNAIRRLMSTGNFENVVILSEGDDPSGVTLTIQVAERPFIVAFDIEGLERVSASAVRDTVGLSANQPLNPQLVLRTQRTIRDMLAQEGVQLAALDTVMIPAEDEPNAYRLAFRVREGNRLAIADIRFEGNQAFDDSQLRGAIATSEEGFLWFRQGRFDRAVFEEDLRQNLPAFYGSNGYIDFNVVSDTLIIDPESGKARVVIEVAEGPQYRLGEFRIDGATRFPQEQLEQMFTARRRSVLGLPFGGSSTREQGEVFDRAALDAATDQVENLYRNEGYLYAQVEPIIQRTEGPDGQPVVDVTWAVSESSPFYINRVMIEGNTYTHESVIRDRLVVFPGDIYSEDRLLQSYRSIAALGFFETPMPTPDIDPDPQNGTVNLTFHVEERSTGSINFGTAIGGGGYGRPGGVSGFLGYSQPNLFGQAKQASIQAEYGYGRSSFTASYSDPALFGTRNSGSISVFHTDDRYRQLTSFSDGQYIRTGASLRFGFPILNFRWTRGFAGYSLSRYSYQARNADDCEEGNVFCQPSAVSSAISAGITRDTRDHPLFPSIGTSQNLTVQQSGGPLGGDGNFQKVTAESQWWTPVGQIGGGAPGSRPIILTFGLSARTGAVFGDASRFPFERFLMGGTQGGLPLRGYEDWTITPFGHFERNAQVSTEQRFGDAFFLVTGEYAIRLNDNISVSLFGDAGGMWNDPTTIDPTRLHRSLGLGATVVTPFGPLGIDYAYGFDKLEPGWQFHFKITQPGM